MADLVAVMNNGVLQQIATPHEIYERPANRFVATFVGSPAMSVLAASVDECLHIGHATITMDGARRDYAEPRVIRYKIHAVENWMNFSAA